MKIKFRFAVINKFFNECQDDAIFDYYRQAEYHLDKIEEKHRDEYMIIAFKI